MIIGIDPGISGGIAVLTDKGSTIAVTKMPVTEADIARFLRPYRKTYIAYIERVHSMPKQGVSSTFKFGCNYGILLGTLAALKIKRVHIQPAKWQGELGCRSKGDKNVTKRKAQELFPREKVTHAIADALLIAEYGRRMENKYAAK